MVKMPDWHLWCSNVSDHWELAFPSNPTYRGSWGRRSRLQRSQSGTWSGWRWRWSRPTPEPCSRWTGRSEGTTGLGRPWLAAIKKATVRQLSLLLESTWRRLNRAITNGKAARAGRANNVPGNIDSSTKRLFVCSDTLAVGELNNQSEWSSDTSGSGDDCDCVVFFPVGKSKRRKKKSILIPF